MIKLKLLCQIANERREKTAEKCDEYSGISAETAKPVHFI
jgi:hypothetical protein